MIVAPQPVVHVAPCGLRGASCGLCSLAPRCGLSGLGQLQPPSWLPEPLRDWKIIAAAVAVILLLAVLGGAGAKRARRKRRAELIKARLRYAEEAARIRRKSL